MPCDDIFRQVAGAVTEPSPPRSRLSAGHRFHITRKRGIVARRLVEEHLAVHLFFARHDGEGGDAHSGAAAAYERESVASPDNGEGKPEQRDNESADIP